MKNGRVETQAWRVIALAVAVLAILTACPSSGAGGDSETYTVTLDRQGGSGGSTSVIATVGAPMPPAGAPSKAGAVFDGYYAGLHRAGARYYTEEMESAKDWDIPADTELIAYWVSIGGPGPAGGHVFYDKGEYTDGWRYLEAAPVSTEWIDKPWGGSGTEVGTAAQGTDVGTGAANTQAIVAAYGSTDPDEARSDYAAKLADDLVFGGYDDWYLPSRDELDLIYQELFAEDTGDFTAIHYWSSSEVNNNSAWVKNFDSDLQGGLSKDLEYRVRAIRAF